MTCTTSPRYMLSDLPETLPIFPLPGVLLLPRGELPLNIFEDRYLAMVNQALATPHRMFGMIQPCDRNVVCENKSGLFDTGCAGRITHFTETDDGRYLITLTGVCRFKIQNELPQQSGFRRIRPDYTPYIHDLTGAQPCTLDRTRLLGLLKEYFKVQGLACNWEQVKEASDDTLINALAMVCPLKASEKQALLESHDTSCRGNTFLTMLELAVIESRKSTGHSASTDQLH